MPTNEIPTPISDNAALFNGEYVSVNVARQLERELAQWRDEIKQHIISCDDMLRHNEDFLWLLAGHAKDCDCDRCSCYRTFLKQLCGLKDKLSALEQSAERKEK
jgi:hypothetical protein